MHYTDLDLEDCTFAQEENKDDNDSDIGDEGF